MAKTEPTTDIEALDEIRRLSSIIDRLSKPERPVLVFAGNARQAEDWARRLPRGAWMYIGSTDALRGRNTHEQPRVFVGTFHERHDAAKIIGALGVTDIRPHRPQDDEAGTGAVHDATEHQYANGGLTAPTRRYPARLGDASPETFVNPSMFILGSGRV